MNRNILKKLGAVALSALMTLGVASQGINSVEASGTYELKYYGQSKGLGSECGNYTIDGRRGWCIEHKKDSPPSGFINGEIYHGTDATSANIRKIMYYGWEGFEPWSGLNTLSDAEKNSLMSMSLSCAYSGTKIRNATIKNFYNYATSQPDPQNKNILKFSKQIVNTWYDQNAKVQKSESSRLNGPNGAHVTINPQTSKVRVVNETRGTSGQIVDVYAGDTVHYEADADYTGNSYSGWLKGGFSFAPLIVHNGNSKQQHIGAWITTDPLEPTCLNADFKAVVGSLKLRKTDTGGKLLDGAVFHVSGNGYDKDVTVANGEITVNDLTIGDYTITEKTAPNGYLVNVAPFKTTVVAGQTAETTITDEAPTGKISIKKSDSKGNIQGEASLEGAEYTVYGPDGQEVGKITTDKDGNGSLENLVLGTYTVKETKAPEAYDLDWNTYTVELTYKDQNTAIILGNVDSKENVKTGKIEIKKTDTEGNPLKSGEFGIYANADMYIGDTLYKKGQLVVSIKTDDSGVARSDDLPYGSYYVKEISAPTQETGNSHNFVLSDDTQYVKINGKNKTDTVTFVDKKVTASKTTITGTQEVPGATLTVKDEDGNTVDTWVSGDKEHYVSGLEEGKTYTLIEETAPEGYVRAEEITFTVTNEKVDQEVNMFDAQVKVTKTDALTGDAVKGAEFTVFDKDGNIVDKWITDGTAHAVSGLDAGKEYIIKETKTPEGYMTAPDRTLVVSGEQNMDVEIKEQPVLTDIEVQKVDAQTKKVIRSKDFEFTMYSDADCKNAITTVSADKNAGTATFKNLRYGTYYIKETKAPTGYLLSKEVKKVVVDDKLENVGKTYSFIYQDTPMPTTGVKTGDGTDIQKFTALTGISGIVLLLCVILILRKKKNAQ